MTEPAVPVRLLHEAAADGVISPGQLERLLARAGAADVPVAPPATRERGGLAAAYVAYWAGALLVLFAFGWFLVDRWRVLGPPGVLAVAAGYAALFVMLHARLGREGLRVASGVALLLAVGTAPLAAWAAQEWLLPLPGELLAVCHGGWGLLAACRLRWTAVELVTVLAALLAMRRLRASPFAPLALPAAVALFSFAHHLAREARHWPYATGQSGWATLAAASLLLALAYGVDRREVRTRTGGALEDDHAAWLFLPALVAGAVALGDLWGQYRELRHLLPLVALALAVGALRLRRRLLLAAAAMALLFYLGYLAFDVFRHTLAFPVLLAAFGLLVIAVAVGLQRLAPRLMRERPPARGDSPAAWAIVLAPAVLALLMGPEARRRDLETDANHRTLARQQALHYRTLERERLRKEAADSARGRSVPGAPTVREQRSETRPPRGA